MKRVNIRCMYCGHTTKVNDHETTTLICYAGACKGNFTFSPNCKIEAFPIEDHLLTGKVKGKSVTVEKNDLFHTAHVYKPDLLFVNEHYLTERKTYTWRIRRMDSGRWPPLKKFWRSLPGIRVLKILLFTALAALISFVGYDLMKRLTGAPDTNFVRSVAVQAIGAIIAVIIVFLFRGPLRRMVKWFFK
jgi:hypothetical protein